MCQCTPNVRTPFCGKPGCEWPDRPSPSHLKANASVILDQPDIIDTICQHISCGGNLADLCRIWHVAFYDVMQWIGVDAGREKKYKAARAAHSEFMEDRILLELKRIAFLDVRQAYDKNGSLLPMTEMPDEVAASIASVDVDDIFEGFGKDRTRIGETKKLRLHSKLDAIKMLGDFRGMWKKADIGNLGKTLEDLISNSHEPTKPSTEAP